MIMKALTELYLVGREIFGLRDGVLDQARVDSLVARLANYERKIQAEDIDRPLTEKELSEFESILQEMEGACGPKQPGLHQKVREDLKWVKNKKKAA